ncbi:MAG: hypothetical protein K1X53_03300 [Candidatus Sumerlaeaceae bacterium]|nr:hypothetical protein [Candidatus Sumerlaeaceae bacterium]
MAWVNSTLASMTLDEKIGQMLMPSYSSGTAPTEVTSRKVGGFIFLGNSNTASAVLSATNSLQGITSVPLIFSIDCEPGPGGRLTDGTDFPMNMALGATRNATYAMEQGKVTARECRAIGVQMAFAPVVDVNTEPINPIIGIRSMSDDPELVKTLAQAMVQGMNSEGLLSTFKHFPGHGATTGDSHSSLPTITISTMEIEKNHVKPYADLLPAGYGNLVMSAHVWYTALDPGTTAWPATLSGNALTTILRNEIGFGGAVISDSFGMAGVQLAASTYDGVRIGVLAGLDIILTPPSLDDAYNGLKDAVTSGLIPMARINDSVRRILSLKSRVGIPETTTNSVATMTATMQHPDNLAAADVVARHAICSARTKPQDLPLTSTQKVYCLTLNASSTIFYLYAASYFTNTLGSRLPLLTTQAVSTSVSSSQRATIVANAQTYDRVVIASYEWKPAMTSNQVLLVEALRASGVKMVYVSFGSPWQITQFPLISNYFCGFSSHPGTQDEMARVLCGESTASGLWPVTISGVTRVDNWPIYGN